jgi:hypothetical protein
MRKIFYNSKSKARIFGTVLVALFVVCASFTVLFLIPQSPFSSKTASAAGENWWNADWRSRKLVTVSSAYITGDVTNFPALVYRSTDSDLASHAQNDGDDIAFVLWSDNTTQLNHELETFDGATGELAAWVNVTSISASTGAKVWMYYNYTEATNQQDIPNTWDSNFSAVYHMNGSGSYIYDSTSNNKIGTKGNTPIQAAGKVGYAQDFQMGDLDHINISEIMGANGTAVGSEGYTIELWQNADTVTEASTRLITNDQDVANSIYIYFSQDSLKSRYVHRDGANGYQTTEVAQISSSQWYYWTCSALDDTSFRLRINFSTTHMVDATTLLAFGQYWILGTSGVLGQPYDGLLDEVRFSDKSRSNHWQNATYNTIANKADFCSFGSEEAGGGDPASACTLYGLTGVQITFTGIAGMSVFCNATGENNDWLRYNMSANATTNYTETRVYVGDLNDTGADITADNIELFVSSDNSSYGSLGSFPSGGGNISVNGTTWPAGSGINPFTDGAGIADRDVDIYYVMKITLPGGFPTDDFYSAAIDTCKFVSGYYSS